MTTEAKQMLPGIIALSIALAIVVIAVAVVLIYRRHVAAREAEAKRQAEILSTPLEKFGDKDLKDLEEKYSD